LIHKISAFTKRQFEIIAVTQLLHLYVVAEIMEKKVYSEDSSVWWFYEIYCECENYDVL